MENVTKTYIESILQLDKHVSHEFNTEPSDFETIFIVHTLLNSFVVSSPNDPLWIGRDRVIISTKNGQSLHVIMLTLLQYDVSCQDFLRDKTQTLAVLRSYGVALIEDSDRREAVALATGLAVGSLMMGARYNTKEISLFRNYVYLIADKVTLQGPLASETLCVAGSLQLSQLIVIHSCKKEDANCLQEKFESCNWNVIKTECDQETAEDKLIKLIHEAKSQNKKPSLILFICSFETSYDDLQCNASVKSSCVEENTAVCLSCSSDCETSRPSVLPIVKSFYKNRGLGCESLRIDWYELLNSYLEKFPRKYSELKLRISNNQCLEKYINFLASYGVNQEKEEAMTKTGAKLLEEVCFLLPNVVGTSSASANLNLKAFAPKSLSSRVLVADHKDCAMAAIANGIHVFGGFRCFVFFEDISSVTAAWPSIRIASKLSYPILYLIPSNDYESTDVISLFRMSSNTLCFRPADLNELKAAFFMWLTQTKTPVILILDPNISKTFERGTSFEKTQKGGYIVKDFDDNQDDIPKWILGGSGPEVKTCIEAAEKYSQQVNFRVVSIPCWELLKKKCEVYKELIVPKNCRSLYIESVNSQLQCNDWFEMTLCREQISADMIFQYIWR